METPELEAPDFSSKEPYVNPKAKKILSKEALEKVVATGKNKKVEARRGKKLPGARVPIHDIRAQVKGPITKGPTTYVVCPICTRLFGRPTGTRTRHAARHLKDHQMGRIRRPTEAK